MNLGSAIAPHDHEEQPRVLLVDDDEVNLLLTSIALRDRGFAITEASSGEQALQMMADWLPDVVVLDAVMPGLDGFATCQELRQMPGYESVPVLMLSLEVDRNLKQVLLVLFMEWMGFIQMQCDNIDFIVIVVLSCSVKIPYLSHL